MNGNVKGDKMSTEQQQNQLTKEMIQNFDKDAEKLQNDYKEVQSQQKTNTSFVGSNNNSGSIIMQFLNVTLVLALMLTIPILLMRRASKKKEKSIFAKVSYHYFKLAIIVSLLIYIWNLINIFNPSISKDYILIVIVIIGAYAFSKIKKKGIKRSSKIDSKLESGVVIGSTNNNLIIKPPNKPGNLLVVGAPGKGKSVNIIIPSLLNWKGSAVVLDIKREIYAYTG